MPTLKELVVKFKADLSELDKAFDEVNGKSGEMGRNIEGANDQVAQSAENAGGTIRDTLNDALEQGAVKAVQWAAAHRTAAIAIGAVAGAAAAAVWIKGQIDDYREAGRAADEYTQSLREQARALGELAIASGRYGGEMRAARAWAKEQEGQKRAAAFSGMSDSVIRDRINQLRAQQSEELRLQNEYTKSTRMWASAPKEEWALRIGGREIWHPQTKATFEARAKEHEDEAKRLGSQIYVLDTVIKLRQYRTAKAEENRKSQQAAQQIDNSANEEANRAAARSRYVLSQATEQDKRAAQAWVDRTEAIEQIRRAQDEAFRAHGVVLDVAEQIKTAEYAYAQKIKEINQAKASAARDAQVDKAVNVLRLRAAQEEDKYARQELDVSAGLLRQLRQLEKDKADHIQVQVAILTAQRRIREIEKERAEDAKRKNEESQRRAADERSANEDARAAMGVMRARDAGNEALAAEIEAKREWVKQQQELDKLEAEGQNVAPRRSLADMERSHKILAAYAEQEKKQREETERQAREKRRQLMDEQSAANRLSGMNAEAAGQGWLAEQWDAYDALTRKLEELNDLKEQGIAVTQREALAQREYSDAYYGAMEKAIQAKREEIENARREAAGRVGFTSIADQGKQAAASGVRAQYLDSREMARKGAMAGMTADDRRANKIVLNSDQQVALLQSLLDVFQRNMVRRPTGVRT